LIPFQLALRFFPLLVFVAFYDIRVLGAPFGSVSFFSSFLQDILDKDVHHADMLLELGDIQVALGILYWCFT
jgi:hypothetical protein